jgi:hypothetical protein
MSDLFLCPKCKYGFRLRIVHSPEGIPIDVEYMCVDPKNTSPFGKYLLGPGGWDPETKTCANFVEGSEPEPEYTITKSEGETVTYNYADMLKARAK